MPITKGYQQLVAEAMAVVTTYSVAAVQARLRDPGTQIVDIRDIRELTEGTLSHLRIVLRDKPVRFVISCSDSLSRKYSEPLFTRGACRPLFRLPIHTPPTPNSVTT